MELTFNELSYNDTIIPCPIEEGHRMIPVKTICAVIDVQYDKQDIWLKNHPYFGELYRPSRSSSADNKVREMNCLPVFDVLSWLSSITDRNRKSGSLEKQYAFMVWLRTKTLDMYKLIDVFQEENKYEMQLLEKKQNLLEQMEDMSRSTSDIKKQIKQIDATIEDVRSKRFTAQTALPFPEN